MWGDLSLIMGPGLRSLQRASRERTNCEPRQSPIGFPRHGLTKAATPRRRVQLRVYVRVSVSHSCQSGGWFIRSVNSADTQRKDARIASLIPPLCFNINAEQVWFLESSELFRNAAVKTCKLAPHGVCTENLTCQVRVINGGFMFSRSLILSLEAKLNLLHNYMNVTWIRIPSETRVTSSSHACCSCLTWLTLLSNIWMEETLQSSINQFYFPVTLQ